MNDLLLNDNNDIEITGGDFLVGTSDSQHEMLLLLTEKGGYKQHPGLGVGLFSQLENEDPAAMLSEIRRQFAADGMTINELNYQGNGKLNIDANY